MFPGARKSWTLRSVSRSMCLFIGLAAFCGCRHNSQDLLEAELRTREQEIARLRTDLQRAETLNYALTHSVPGPCAPGGPASVPGVVEGQPTAAMSGTVKEVTLGRGTGGLEDGTGGGDQGLEVVVVPRDTDGSAIKAPGNLHVEAFEVSSEGLKIPLSTWEVSSLQLSRQWRNGLFSTGYFVDLPWKAVPHSEKLRVIMRFTTLPDRRNFEDDKTVVVKLPTAARHGMQPPDGVPSTTAPVLPPTVVPEVGEGPFFPTTSAPAGKEPAARLMPARPDDGSSSQPVQLLKPQLPPQQ
ncbi:MAG TPA: hypothetical protein VKS79_21585 [Gemmataceae bacterium]|nr:hypothetical protein [Gemmataceae bacterium]